MYRVEDEFRNHRMQLSASCLSFQLSQDVQQPFVKFWEVNQELGEIGGVFVSKQPSDTDMGAKAPRPW